MGVQEDLVGSYKSPGPVATIPGRIRSPGADAI